MANLFFPEEESIKKYNTLYTILKTGNIGVFNLEVTSENRKGVITRSWGQLGGKMQTKRTVISKGKNLNKSNATTPITQAVSEADSIYQSKKDDNYQAMEEFGYEPAPLQSGAMYVTFEPPYKILTQKSLVDFISSNFKKFNETGSMFKAMKLHHYRLSTYKKGQNIYNRSKNLTTKYEYLYVQPKFDGICCLASKKHGLWTREGKPTATAGGALWKDVCPNIYRDISILPQDYVFNGEVYCHGIPLQQIGSWCKRRQKNSDKLVFYIFDVVAPELTFQERHAYMISLIKEYGNLANVRFMPTAIIANTEVSILESEYKYLNEGYEGIIIREPDGMYEIGGRSRSVLKLVREDSDEMQIKDIVPMDNEPSCGLFIVTYKGNTFNVTPSHFTHTERQNLLKNKQKYIGKMLTVIFRGETKDGIPKFCQGKSIRLD
jgi:DNA ligase-1